MGIFKEQKTIVVKCNDQDNTLEDLLNYIKTNGNTGHSFSIVVDPKSPSMKTFGWDGDGGDSIKSINTSFKEWMVLTERKSSFQTLKDNKVPLSDEERKMCLDAKAVWNHFDKPTSAVWKSINPKTKKTTYVTNTHRAYNTASTCKGAISRYHKFIKGTA